MLVARFKLTFCGLGNIRLHKQKNDSRYFKRVTGEIWTHDLRVHSPAFLPTELLPPEKRQRVDLNHRNGDYPLNSLAGSRNQPLCHVAINRSHRIWTHIHRVGAGYPTIERETYKYRWMESNHHYPRIRRASYLWKTSAKDIEWIFFYSLFIIHSDFQQKSVTPISGFEPLHRVTDYSTLSKRVPYQLGLYGLISFS